MGRARGRSLARPAVARCRRLAVGPLACAAPGPFALIVLDGGPGRGAECRGAVSAVVTGGSELTASSDAADGITDQLRSPPTCRSTARSRAEGPMACAGLVSIVVNGGPGANVIVLAAVTATDFPQSQTSPCAAVTVATTSTPPGSRTRGRAGPGTSDAAIGNIGDDS